MCVCVCVWQVQNISQSMEVLELRTYRDLQYVRNTESLMKVVDGKLKVASENPRSLNPKGFQVIGCLSPLVQQGMCVLLSSECRYYYMWHHSPCAHKLCQMHCNLFRSSQTIKFCTTLNRLPHKHTYTKFNSKTISQSLSRVQRKFEKIHMLLNY